MEAGHTSAMNYPLGRLYDEASFVEERRNTLLITEAQLMQQVVASVLSKGARKQFSKTIKSLNVETKARAGLFDQEE